MPLYFKACTESRMKDKKLREKIFYVHILCLFFTIVVLLKILQDDWKRNKIPNKFQKRDKSLCNISKYPKFDYNDYNDYNDYKTSSKISNEQKRN